MFTALLSGMLGITLNGAVSQVSDTPGAWIRGTVMYAEVTEVTKGNVGFQYTIGLLPLATVTGSIDPIRQGPISAECYTGGQIDEVPAKGSKVLVYVWRYETDGKSGYMIPDGAAAVMPDAKGIVEVKGFDDPKVMQTIKSARALYVETKGRTAVNPIDVKKAIDRAVEELTNRNAKLGKANDTTAAEKAPPEKHPAPPASTGK